MAATVDLPYTSLVPDSRDRKQTLSPKEDRGSQSSVSSTPRQITMSTASTSGSNPPSRGSHASERTSSGSSRGRSVSSGKKAKDYLPQMPRLHSSSPTPLAQMGFAGARHLVTERLPSARKERLTTMRVLELSEQAIESISNDSHHLRRLDLSKLRMNVLPEECLEQLVHLERLDISYNDLSEDGFPESLKNMENLLELAAEGNQITEIPRVVKRLRTLQRLKLARNKVKSITGIEKLRKLTIVILDKNEIETLHRDFYNSLKRLELFHCANNRIKELSSDIRNLRHLKDIDVSNNQLSTLPVELFLLPRIDIIIASNNNIIRLPSVVVKNQSKKKLSHIDLSGNSLVKFPDHLLTLTNRLDLSANRLRSIPAKILKILDCDTIDELILDDNPLISPPSDVCECGIKSIMQYLQEARSEMKVHQGLKVLVVGSYMAGKTSLIHSLVDQQSRLVEKNDRTVGVDHYDTAFEIDEGEPLGKSLQLTILDFSGHSNYLFSHYTFLTQPSLMLLVFDLSTYEPDNFYDMIGAWIDWNLIKTNKLVILPVGTHADKVKRKQSILDICADVSAKLSAHTTKHIKSIEREIKKIESKPHISPAMSEQLKVCINLLKMQSTIFDKIVITSSVTLAGFTDLQLAIIEMATNKTTYPNVMRHIPSLWAEVENYLDDRGYVMQVLMIRWERYEGDITKRFGMKRLIPQITQYLQETGKVIWFGEHSTLRENGRKTYLPEPGKQKGNWVILRPSWLSDIIKPLFRPEFGDSSITEDSLKQLGISHQRFDKMKKEMLEEGIISREMIKFLWFGIVPYELKSTFNDAITMLLDEFEFGYAIEKSSREGAIDVVRRYDCSATKDDDAQSSISVASHQSFRPSRVVGKESGNESRSASVAEGEAPPSHRYTESKPKYIHRILIPWIRNIPRPDGFKEEYEKFVDNSVLVANFRFPHFMPPGVFETMAVRAIKHHDLDVIFHWRDDLYARHIDEPLRMYLLRINHDDGSNCVRVELRHERLIEEDGVEALWMVMLAYVRDVDNLLHQFSGLQVERNMECPKCHALTFLGEWQTPKELQSSKSKKCDNCKSDVSTVYLIQPKEKRRVEEFLKQRLREEHEKRQREEDQKITSIPETEEVTGTTPPAVPAEPTNVRKVSSSSRPSSRQSVKRRQTKSQIQS